MSAENNNKRIEDIEISLNEIKKEIRHIREIVDIFLLNRTDKFVTQKDLKILELELKLK